MDLRTAVPTMLVAALLLMPGIGRSDIQFEDATDLLGPFGVGESWGASWGDLDADGWPDLFLSNHRLRAALYRNEGPNGFRDVTLEADRSSSWILTPWNDQHGGAWGDYNNDGFQDLMVSTGRSFDEQFFENVGGALLDRTVWAGINGVGVGDGRHGTWLDINNDGLLDLISVNFGDNLIWERQASGSTGFIRSNRDYGFNRVCLFGNLAVQLFDAVGTGGLDILCTNDSDFPSALFDASTIPLVNVKDMLPPVALVNDVALGDFNGNLRTDLLVLRGGLRLNEALQVGPDRIEANIQVGENSGGSKGFRFTTQGIVTFDVSTEQFWEGYVYIGANGWNPPNVSDLSFVLDPADPQTWGIQTHDPSIRDRGIYVGFDPNSQTWNVQVYSDDLGRRSYFFTSSTQPITNLQATGLTGADLPWTPRLFRNTVSGFEDVTNASQMNVPLQCVSVVAGDFDNDGDLDLYFVCRGGAQNLPNRLFENRGDGTFVEVGATGAAGPIGFNVAQGAGTGESVAVADVDLDGFLDLFVTNGLNMQPVDYGGPNQLFRNLGNSNNWILLDLVGVQSNRDAVGAKVFATAGGKAQVREQAGGIHRWSQDHQRIHFGLAQSTTVDLRVEWPSGQVDEYSGLSANELYRATEGVGVEIVDRVPPPEGLGPQPGDECGAPIYDLFLDPGVFVWKECDTGGWRVRVSGGGLPDTTLYRGTVSATRPFSSLTPEGLEGLDRAVAANSNTIDYSLYVALAGEDGFAFEPASEGNVCFGLDEPAWGSVYLGSRRKQVNGHFDLATLGPCPIVSAVSVDDVSVAEGDGVAGFVVTLSAPSDGSVTVSYATADGTATAGQDYVAASGVLTFSPGETERLVEVPILTDGVAEPTEQFELVLSGASGATIARATAVGTILDDDTPLSCGQPSYAAGSEAGLFLWQDCANAQWHARVTAGGSSSAIVYRGEIVASESFTQAQGVLLELPWDVVDVSDPTRLGFTLGVQGSGQDGLAFALPAETDVCFRLQAPAGARVFLGVGKKVMTEPFDLTTLGACVPPPAISISDASVSESEGLASVVVSLSAPRNVPVTVNYATVDGVALAGQDYVTTAGSLAFAPGETQKVVEVEIIDDGLVEPTETFGVLLSNAVGAALGQATATVSILDNDVPLPELSVGDVTASEADGVLGFVVSLSAASEVPVTVGYSTSDGTASAGSDYLAAGGSEGLTFQPGETTKIVDVELIDDDIPESTETFYMGLINPEGAVLARAQGTATILDDDALPVSCGEPVFAPGSEAGLFLWQDCASAQWHARVAAGGSATVLRFTGSVESSAPFTTAAGVLLELPSDQVNTSNPSRMTYRLNVLGTGVDGLTFAFPPGVQVCFALDGPAGMQTYLGAGKVAMPAAFDLTTLGACGAEPPVPTLSVSDGTVSEGGGVAGFAVSLSSASAEAVTVSYATADGTATAGQDYGSASGVLTFAPGQTAQVVEVAVLDDAVSEATESFELVLSGASGATIARAAAVGTILDDDGFAGPACGAPVYSAATEAAVFLYYDCADPRQWRVRFTAGGVSGSYRGTLSSDAPFESLVGVSQEATDVLNPAPFATPTAGPINYVQNVGGNGFDGFEFRLAEGARACFNLTAPAGRPVWIGSDRVAASVPVDPTTLQVCTP